MAGQLLLEMLDSDEDDDLQPMDHPIEKVERKDPFKCLSDQEFFRRYRFSKETVRVISDIVCDDLQRETKRNNALPVDIQVTMALQYFATGTFQQIVGDTLNISQPSISRIIKNVSIALARKSDRYIKINNENINRKKQDFYNIAHFPNCIGAIDCTHVKIKKPNTDPEYFINRKGSYSINVQAVCDANRKFTNIVARWPGSVHDSRIFNESILKTYFEEGELEGVLVGDSGYACLPYLLTPVLNRKLHY